LREQAHAKLTLVVSVDRERLSDVCQPDAQLVSPR
jgi:hypothetical protein